MKAATAAAPAAALAPPALAVSDAASQKRWKSARGRDPLGWTFASAAAALGTEVAAYECAWTPAVALEPGPDPAVAVVVLAVDEDEDDEDEAAAAMKDDRAKSAAPPDGAGGRRKSFASSCASATQSAAE